MNVCEENATELHIEFNVSKSKLMVWNKKTNNSMKTFCFG